MGSAPVEEQSTSVRGQSRGVPPVSFITVEVVGGSGNFPIESLKIGRYQVGPDENFALRGMS